MRRDNPRAALSADRPGTPDPLLYDAVRDCELIALLVQLPTERVLAASAAAEQLLAEGAELTGQLLADVAGADPAAGHRPPAGGGYQSRRSVLGSRLELWLWPVPELPEVAIVVAAPPGRAWHGTRPGVEWPGTRTEQLAIGASDEQLLVDRVSEDIEALLGVAPADLLGQSLVQLVTPEDISELLFALARATAEQRGLSVNLHLSRADTGPLPGQLMLLPLLPQPRFAFALLPVLDLTVIGRSVGELGLLLLRLAQAVLAVDTARALTEVARPRGRPLAELTVRETEIVTRLLAGDRVPAIARQLFLAQSTVRNHLSAVFGKLGVKSQQELIVLLRQAQNPGPD
ncbi:MAG: LuxR C-terminal-related transcriptional regulator [Jatrophihabitans sp.]